MATISASEINLYKTCARAWAFKKRGVLSNSGERLSAGIAYHHELGSRSNQIRRIRSAVMILFGIVLILVICLLMARGSE